MGIKGKFAEKVASHTMTDTSFGQACRDIEVVMIDATQTFHRIVARPVGSKVRECFPNLQTCIDKSPIIGNVERQSWRDVDDGVVIHVAARIPGCVTNINKLGRAVVHTHILDVVYR